MGRRSKVAMRTRPLPENDESKVLHREQAKEAKEEKEEKEEEKEKEKEDEVERMEMGSALCHLYDGEKLVRNGKSIIAHHPEPPHGEKSQWDQSKLDRRGGGDNLSGIKNPSPLEGLQVEAKRNKRKGFQRAMSSNILSNERQKEVLMELSISADFRIAKLELKNTWEAFNNVTSCSNILNSFENGSGKSKKKASMGIKRRKQYVPRKQKKPLIEEVKKLHYQCEFQQVSRSELINTSSLMKRKVSMESENTCQKTNKPFFGEHDIVIADAPQHVAIEHSDICMDARCEEKIEESNFDIGIEQFKRVRKRKLFFERGQTPNCIVEEALVDDPNKNVEAFEASIEEKGCQNLNHNNFLLESTEKMNMMSIDGETVAASNHITEIIKAISYNNCITEDKQEITVLFRALRCDGIEILVDNRFMRSCYPQILLDFYEKNLKFNCTSGLSGC